MFAKSFGGLSMIYGITSWFKTCGNQCSSKISNYCFLMVLVKSGQPFNSAHQVQLLGHLHVSAHQIQLLAQNTVAMHTELNPIVFHLWRQWHCLEFIVNICINPHCRLHIVSWEPEGRYCCTKSMAIAPFWFSTEHLWAAITPFWLSTDDI